MELDGWESHGTRASFEADRIRDADHLLAGYRVLRVSRRRLHDSPAEVADTVLSLVSLGCR